MCLTRGVTIWHGHVLVERISTAQHLATRTLLLVCVCSVLMGSSALTCCLRLSSQGEDTALALELQCRGRTGVYLRERLAVGEVPEGLRATCMQKSRW